MIVISCSWVGLRVQVLNQSVRVKIGGGGYPTDFCQRNRVSSVLHVAILRGEYYRHNVPNNTYLSV
jgi:hypothetical protein